ncbi:MAG: DEAD/DEAH box helicase [Deltaproteobacteria bacterium]|nr:DEAD/DEAH box helicase [Deltaproteobacteria bacterium]
MNPALTKLAIVIQRRCNVRLYQEGERLAAGVLISRQDHDECVLAVPAPHYEVPPTVALYFETLEWSCDCGSELDPCAHVAASVIALQRSARGEGSVGSLKAAQAELRYTLTVRESTLSLVRTLVLPSGESHEIHTLSECAARAQGAVLALDDDDRALEECLAQRPLRDLSLRSAVAMCELLARKSGLLCEGAPVRASEHTVMIEARADVSRDGWNLTARLPKDTVRYDGPWCISEGTLRPLSWPSQRALPWSERVARKDTAIMVSELLPTLEPHVVWQRGSAKLPALRTKDFPQILFELDHGRRLLSVVPWVVYGDPTRARIEGGRMVYVQGDVPVRDSAREVDLAHTLRDELGLIPGRKVTYEGADAGIFLTKMRGFEARVGGSSDQRSLSSRKLVPTMRVDGARVEMDFVLHDSHQLRDESGNEVEGVARHASAAQVLAAYESGHDVVAIEGGGFAPLPQEFLTQHGHLLAQLLAAKDADGETSKVAAPAVLALAEALEQPAPPAFESMRPLFERFDELPTAKLPENFVCDLREYQRHGVNWLQFITQNELGGILADDMGLGKTVQCLAAMRGRTLVVCPRSVLDNWASEAQRFRPGMRVCVYHGDSRALDASAELTLTTYAILRLDAEKLQSVQWDVAILDEAQNIKNPDAQASRAAFGLKATARFALSGTPVENRLDELWSLLRFASPGLLGGRSEFDQRIAKPIESGDSTALARLRVRLRPFVLRRHKRDVLKELPPRTDVILRCTLSDRERAVYDAVRASTVASAVKALREGGAVLSALEALLRLRQAACHSSLVPGQGERESSAKLDVLVEQLETVVGAGHKALVFSQWTSLLDRIEPVLARAGIAFARLDGSTRDRGAVVQSFQSDDGPPVLLVSLKAGGTGLNLTAADHVFLLDPWWNPATEDQAADRAHRMGQTRPVTLYRMVTEDSVEERLLALQSRKRALASAALDEGALGEALTREDLLALLEGTA